MGNESDPVGRLDGDASFPGLFRLRPGILLAGVFSPHRRLGGGGRAQLSDVDHPGAPRWGHTRSRQCATITGALSHHVPHLRPGMWLLLSNAGRVSSSFGSFDGFKGYWHDRLAQLRQGHAGPLTPCSSRSSISSLREERASRESTLPSASRSRFAVDDHRVRSTQSRRTSPWCVGPTTCGISKTARWHATLPTENKATSP